MLARSQIRALRSISKPFLHPSLTKTWQPLFSPPGIVYSRHLAAQKRSYADPNRPLPAGLLHRLRNKYRASPISMSFWTIIIFGSLVYAGSAWQKRSEYRKAVREIYPDSVSTELEKAVWHTNERQDYRQAIEHYNKALAQAQKQGLHPYNAEVIGIRIRIAHTYEIFHQIRQAIGVLKGIKTDCQEFLAQDSSLSYLERLYIIATSVQLSMKIGEHYSSDPINDLAAAEPYLIDGVETILREQARLKETGVSLADLKPLERWFFSGEVGAAFEMLAIHYTQKSRRDLALPLYFTSLPYCPKNCHRTILMGSVGVAIATLELERDPKIFATSPDRIELPIRYEEDALALAQEIKPPERTFECDLTCLMAPYHLGYFESLRGRYEQARKRYEEAMSMAKAVNHQVMVRVIQDAMLTLQRQIEGENPDTTIVRSTSSMVDEH